jgi:hypothetical protein
MTLPERMNGMLSSTDELEQFLDSSLDSLLEIMGADTGWLQLLAPGGDHLLAAACRGCTDEMKKAAEALALREAGRPAEAGAFIVADLASDPNFAPFSRAGYASLIAVPLSTTLFKGFLGFVSRGPAAFDGESADVLRLKASLIGAALEKGARSRGLADVLARQPHISIRDLKRLATSAGEHCREVSQAVKKAIGRTRGIDKKYTRATINLARETARWEGLLKKYRVEFARPIEAAGPEAPAPPEVPPVETAPEPVISAAAEPPENVPAIEAAPPVEPPVEKPFEKHTGRMQAFRRSHTGQK